MSAVQIIPVVTQAQRAAAYDIRRAVFVAEQGVSEALELDGRDDEAWHLLALQAGRPVGTLRMRVLEAGALAKIERVAVLPEARGLAIGRRLMAAALAKAAADGRSWAKLHAQLQVQEFYAKLGFIAEGARFEEDGIMHVAMRLALQPARTASAC